jgi:hypothetical protein
MRWHLVGAHAITRSVVLRLVIVVLLLVAATACKHNKRANTTVRERAAFDLLCEPNELELGIVDTEGARKLATQIAVYGCDKKAVYVYYPDADTWVINGQVTEAQDGIEMIHRELGEGRDKKSKRKANKAEKKGRMDEGY